MTQAADGTEVAESSESFASVSTGVQLCYQTFGDRAGEPMLLVMGLGSPMTWWDPEFCRMLARRGYFVIRYDNRDCGRSTDHGGRVSTTKIVRAYFGLLHSPPYAMADLAADAVALLDHLGIGAAHLVGISMGGMIVQTVAVEYPGRVRSLVSIMSTTGSHRVGWVSPRLIPTMLTPAPKTREEYLAGAASSWRRLASPAFPPSDEDITSRAADTWDRGINPAGTARQMLAILSQPDRTARLRRLRVPTAVVHGTSDPLVHVSGGKATAAAVPDSELLLIDGMAHDLPEQVWARVVDVIGRTAGRADGSGARRV